MSFKDTIKKIPVWVLIVLGIIAVMGILPGEGNKMANANNMAMINTQFTCETDLDCPSCIGDFSEVSAKKTSAMSQCSAGVCKLSDTCIYWDCGTQENCQSTRQTILDNTVQKFNDYPWLLIALLAIGVIALILSIEK